MNLCRSILLSFILFFIQGVTEFPETGYKAPQEIGFGVKKMFYIV